MNIRQRDERLAALVKNYPALYDKSIPEFKDRQITSMIWKEIARNLGLKSGKDAKLKFRNLRKRYAAVVKKRILGAKSGISEQELARLSAQYHFLLWLDVFIQPRCTSQAAYEEEDEDEDDDIFDETADVDEAASENEAEFCDPGPSEVKATPRDMIIRHTSASFPVSHNPAVLESTPMHMQPQRPYRVEKKDPETGLNRWENTRRKRERRREEERHAAELDMLRSLGNTVSSKEVKDEIGIFTDCVATKLKKLSEEGKLIAQIRIDTILNELLARENGIVPAMLRAPDPIQHEIPVRNENFSYSVHLGSYHATTTPNQRVVSVTSQTPTTGLTSAAAVSTPASLVAERKDVSISAEPSACFD